MRCRNFSFPIPSSDCFHRDRTLVDTLVPAGGGGGGVRGGEGFDKCPGGGGGHERVQETGENGFWRNQNQPISHISFRCGCASRKLWWIFSKGNTHVQDSSLSSVPLHLSRVLLRRMRRGQVINGTSRSRIGFTSLHLLVSWTNIYAFGGNILQRSTVLTSFIYSDVFSWFSDTAFVSIFSRG